MTFMIATSMPFTLEWIFSEYNEQCYSQAGMNGVFGSNICNAVHVCVSIYPGEPGLSSQVLSPQSNPGVSPGGR